MAKTPRRGSAPKTEPEATAAPKGGRVQVLVRMTPAERKALKRIALERDTTVQALVEKAIRDLLRRHGAEL